MTCREKEIEVPTRSEKMHTLTILLSHTQRLLNFVTFKMQRTKPAKPLTCFPVALTGEDDENENKRSKLESKNKKNEEEDDEEEEEEDEAVEEEEDDDDVKVVRDIKRCTSWSITEQICTLQTTLSDLWDVHHNVNRGVANLDDFMVVHNILHCQMEKYETCLKQEIVQKDLIEFDFELFQRQLPFLYQEAKGPQKEFILQQQNGARAYLKALLEDMTTIKHMMLFYDYKFQKTFEGKEFVRLQVAVYKAATALQKLDMRDNIKVFKMNFMDSIGQEFCDKLIEALETKSVTIMFHAHKRFEQIKSEFKEDIKKMECLAPLVDGEESDEESVSY